MRKIDERETFLRKLRANRAKSALTALFLVLALASVALMRGHTAAPLDPEQPINGGNNNPSNPPPYPITLSPPDEWEGWMPTATETIVFTAVADISHPGEASVTFHLSEVTSYKGRYMNDEDWKNHQGTDLYFAPAEDQQTKYGNKITWSGGARSRQLSKPAGRQGLSDRLRSL